MGVKKGKRGKKICGQCQEFVPIHSQKCWNCPFMFKMNHKPKKEKVAFLGEPIYCFDKVSYYKLPNTTPSLPLAVQQTHTGQLSLILSKNKFYGLSKPLSQENVFPQNSDLQRRSSRVKVKDVSDSESTFNQDDLKIIPFGDATTKQFQMLNQIMVKRSLRAEFYDLSKLKSIINFLTPTFNQHGLTFTQKIVKIEVEVNQVAMSLEVKTFKSVQISQDINMLVLDHGYEVLKTQWLVSSKTLLCSIKHTVVNEECPSSQEKKRINKGEEMVQSRNNSEDFLLLASSNIFEAANQTKSYQIQYVIKVIKLTDFDTIKSKIVNKDVLALIATVEDGAIRMFSIPELHLVGPNVEIEPTKVIQSPNMNYCLVRLLQYGSQDQLAATDFACNLHFFDLPKPHHRDKQSTFLQRPTFTIHNAHSKLISDIQLIALSQEKPEESVSQSDFEGSSDQSEQPEQNLQIYLASCSFDGFLKIWDRNQQDNFRPVFEHFSSKKWIFSITFDPTTLCIYCNSEGKHFPQKIFYLQQNRIIPRKYNFFSENILTSDVPAGQDFVYSSGINGLVYRMSKQDICRHLVKQKEKLKNKQVTRLLSVQATQVPLIIKINNENPIEDPNEEYLFDRGPNAITTMSLIKTGQDQVLMALSMRNVPLLLFNQI